MALIHAETSEAVIKAFDDVYNTLGYGFLEKVYENSLRIALQKRGLDVRQQCPITVRYEGDVVGEYFADLLVDGRIVVEIKAAETICQEHEHQLINYLEAISYQVGLLLNLGPQPEFRRRVLTTKANFSLNSDPR